MLLSLLDNNGTLVLTRKIRNFFMLSSAWKKMSFCFIRFTCQTGVKECGNF